MATGKCGAQMLKQMHDFKIDQSKGIPSRTALVRGLPDSTGESSLPLYCTVVRSEMNVYLPVRWRRITCISGPAWPLT